jgi:hypothetical protein
VRLVPLTYVVALKLLAAILSTGAVMAHGPMPSVRPPPVHVPTVRPPDLSGATRSGVDAARSAAQGAQGAVGGGASSQGGASTDPAGSGNKAAGGDGFGTRISSGIKWIGSKVIVVVKGAITYVTLTSSPFSPSPIPAPIPQINAIHTVYTTVKTVAPIVEKELERRGQEHQERTGAAQQAIQDRVDQGAGVFHPRALNDPSLME